MSKPDIREPYRSLEEDLFATMKVGLKEWRPDLNFPESYSDFQGCIRALFRMFEIKRRPLAIRMEEILEPEPRCPWCGISLKGQACVYSGNDSTFVLCDSCGKKIRGENPCQKTL